ncbi:hypothetical protein ZWY2020_007078 [Hordeum vulgare]|nr:hypothetical protein ZWY2020_007078 [Hordeum vulgare]
MEDTTATSSVIPTAGVADDTHRYPAWVLLEEDARYEDLENDTSAEAKTSTGHVVRVTFVLANPPAVSYFCIHGSGLKREDHFLEPQVVFSEKRLVLLRFAFTIGLRNTVHNGHLSEYFVYRATPAPGKPSLRPTPTSTLSPTRVNRIPPSRRSPTTTTTSSLPISHSQLPVKIRFRLCNTQY